MSIRSRLLFSLIAGTFLSSISAQAPPTEVVPPSAAAPALDVDATVRECVGHLLALQERAADGEPELWSYEGVYRYRGQIPIGYHVGGTAIVALALVAAPRDAAEAGPRDAALARAVGAILRLLDEPGMNDEFVGNYDVRGWGHCYALQLFLRLVDAKATPAEHADAVASWIPRLVRILCDSAIPESGGWNYSRPRGYRSSSNRGSPFMTAPTLQALFHAQARGHDVDADVIDAALASIDRARTGPGGYAYASPAKSANATDEADLAFMDRTPGAIGRMVCCETALTLAGRGDAERLAAAVAAFFEHWDALEVRRKKTGTHLQPYGVAPYYFLFAHWYVAQAIELLPEAARAAPRAKLHALLRDVREPDGTWNDRVFARSAAYGTAVAMLALRPAALIERPQPATKSRKGG